MIKIDGRPRHPDVPKPSPPLPPPANASASADAPAFRIDGRARHAPSTAHEKAVRPRAARSKRESLPLRLPPAVKAQLRAFAKRMGMSMNEVVVMAIVFATK